MTWWRLGMWSCVCTSIYPQWKKNPNYCSVFPLRIRPMFNNSERGIREEKKWLELICWTLFPFKCTWSLSQKPSSTPLLLGKIRDQEFHTSRFTACSTGRYDYILYTVWNTGCVCNHHTVKSGEFLYPLINKASIGSGSYILTISHNLLKTWQFILWLSIIAFLLLVS